MDDRDEMDEGINESAALAARMLRADVPVRAAWRAALLARIESDSRFERATRGWTIRPAVAIAASLIFMLVGAAGSVLVSRLARPAAVPLTASGQPTVRFVYVAPGAAHVAIVGDFNQWNPSAIPLKRLSDGTWIADVPLPPGRYAYAFVVDGKIEADPSAPRAADSDFGVTNSIVMVRGS